MRKFEKWHLAKDLERTKKKLEGILESGKFSKEKEALCVAFFGLVRFFPHLSEGSLRRAMEGRHEENFVAMKKALRIFAYKGEGKQRAIAISVHLFLFAWTNFVEAEKENIFDGHSGVHALLYASMFFVANFGMENLT